MKKPVANGKSACCSQPFWSPWSGTEDLRGWIPPEGPLNSTWLSHGVHTGPSQHPMCLPGWSLPCSTSTALLGFLLAAPLLPPCPPQQPPHTQLSHKGEAFAQVWLNFFLLLFQSSGSRQWGWALSQGILQLPYLRIKMYFTLYPHGHALPCLGSSTIYSKQI